MNVTIRPGPIDYIGISGHAEFSWTVRTARLSARRSREPCCDGGRSYAPLRGCRPAQPPERPRVSRPPVTASFDDLRRRGLPEVLFVHSFLPEGVIICDINVFAAMIKEAQAAGSRRYVRPDEYGNDQCAGLGGTGIWEWLVVRAGKPVNGDRYASLHQGICRILFTPEKDGQRLCTVDLNGYPGHEPEDDSPIMATRTWLLCRKFT
jgi:hypothetical protein